MRIRTRLIVSALASAFIAALIAAAPFAGADFHVLRRFTLGGSGSWDYVAIDTSGHRVFIARQNRVMVVDPSSGKLLGEIKGLARAHGVAFSYVDGKGYATSGDDSTVTIFDLKTLRVVGRTIAAPDADAVLFDSVTHRVFTFNGDSHSSSVLDATTGKKVGTVKLGGAPEFGVSDGAGKLYVNLEDAGAIEEIDARSLTVTRHWSIAPCTKPTGLALDQAHHRLFSGCRNKVMAISDAVGGKVLKTLPIDAGVDATAFDVTTQNAYSSNGAGTLTVIHELSPDSFVVAQTVSTMPGARTMALDVRTHRIYTVSAKMGAAPSQSTPANPERRPPVLPGTFTLLELGQ
jgi:DNA-binding beta-propeller fold protein YncE